MTLCVLTYLSMYCIQTYRWKESSFALTHEKTGIYTEISYHTIFHPLIVISQLIFVQLCRQNFQDLLLCVQACGIHFVSSISIAVLLSANPFHFSINFKAPFSVLYWSTCACTHAQVLIAKLEL